MAETRKQTERRIAVLEDFEQKLRDYVEECARHDDERHWSPKQLEKRKRDLSELAPAADKAMRVSGVGVPGLERPRMLGGGPWLTTLPSLIFYHDAVGGDESGLGIQRIILQHIPAAIGALKTQQEEAPDMGPANWGKETANTAAPTPPLEAGDRKESESPGSKSHLPTLFGKLSFVPPLVAFIADLSVAIVAVAAVIVFLVHFLF